MTFEVFRHREHAAPVLARTSTAGTAEGDLASIQAFTEDRWIVGRVRITGRLSDELNRREPVPVFAVQARPLAAPLGSGQRQPHPGAPAEDGPIGAHELLDSGRSLAEDAPLGAHEPLDSAADVQALDPYELVVVAAGRDSQLPLTLEERAALRTHKTRYEVCLELSGAYVCGTVHLYPGTDPRDLAGYRPDLFVPITDPMIRVGDARIQAPAIDVALVNLAYLRSVEAVERSADGWPEPPGPTEPR
ncbi:MAG: hypothetical protein ACP5VP_11030 [Candidatus Limnocylindrales bacterium]